MKPATGDYPPVFKVAPDSAKPLGLHETGEPIAIRTAARALPGMQKEAMVRYGTNDSVWRILCDEGPWLNGTDLAPFPLGYFSAGLAASYLSEFISHARQRRVKIHALQAMVDSRYSMEGSLLKGTMQAGAQPVNVLFSVDADASEAELFELACLAVTTSPADAFLRNTGSSLFRLNRNGESLTAPGVEVPLPDAEDPLRLFDEMRPEDVAGMAAIVEKRPEVTYLGGERLGTVKSGAEVGLSDTQKRQLHVRAVGTLREDGMKEIEVACFNPVGSVFKLLSDDSTLAGGLARAPSGLAYLSAAISFCYMTQLGRYAQVAKQQLRSYRIVQDTVFSPSQTLAGSAVRSGYAPIETAIFLNTDETHQDSQRMVRMGEQTCYLHAACRTPLKTRVQAVKC